MKLLQECEKAQRIGIGGHLRPDGDCVGSCLSLYQYLKKCLPEQIYIKVFLEQPSAIFSKLKGFEEIECELPKEEQFDVFFILDCNKERLGERVKYCESAGKVINIDHHISNAGDGDLNYIRPQVGSTSELIYDLIVAESGEDVLDKELAETLYTGIIHDTGVFQYSNTTPKTMEIGAKLISYGFDFSGLIQESFYQRSYLQSQVLG